MELRKAPNVNKLIQNKDGSIEYFLDSNIKKKRKYIPFIAIITIIAIQQLLNEHSLKLPVLIIFFLSDLVVIGYISEYFLDAGQKFAHSIGIPTFVLGLVIIPLFASLPEDIIAILSNIQNPSLNEMVLASTLTNNLFELLIIFGVVGALICTRSKCISVQQQERQIVLRNSVIMVIASLLGTILAFSDGKLNWIDGLILLLFYSMFITIVYFTNKVGHDEINEEELGDIEEINTLKQFGLMLFYLT